MADYERPKTQASIAHPSLLQKLTYVLPKDNTFNIYHLSTPPTRTSSLFSAPPGSHPDRTYCENHFLAVSIQVQRDDAGSIEEEVLVFAVEILIYSTACDTTFFVSKADSTGFLHLLGLQKGTPSPIRDITATFLGHLVEQRQRANLRSVISLFARAQDQYLFPGSIEYNGKHVLDDRGLVRWWCRVLDPLLEEQAFSITTSSQWESVKGYLTVPGLETYETRSYLPKRNDRLDSWSIGHPLLQLSHHKEAVPTRCLIPHFPDDPKARFLDELDEEISKGTHDSNGQWKSVKSIDQFWDMMAFRQECSAGRMVGFIWVVFTPKSKQQPSDSVIGDSQPTEIYSQESDASFSQSATIDQSRLPVTPATSFAASSQVREPISPVQAPTPVVLLENSQASDSKKSQRSSKKRKLRGPIVPRQPKVKTENKSYMGKLLDLPESTIYYSWRPDGRGQIIVDQSDYKRVTELLLRLDFANLKLATSSSSRWINEVRSSVATGLREAWGSKVTGMKPIQIQSQAGSTSVNALSVGLVRKKRKEAPEEAVAPTLAPTVASPGVNVLSAGMVRKKVKT